MRNSRVVSLPCRRGGRLLGHTQRLCYLIGSTQPMLLLSAFHPLAQAHCKPPFLAPFMIDSHKVVPATGALLAPT